VFRHGKPEAEIARLIASLALFPERGHLVGAYSLGKAQRVIALIRAAGCDRRVVDLHKPGLSGIRIRPPRRRLISALYFNIYQKKSL
jgi:hypothetical protein